MATPVYANQNLLLPQFGESPANYMIKSLPFALNYQETMENAPARRRLYEAQANLAESKANNAQMAQKLYQDLSAPGAQPIKFSSGAVLGPQEAFGMSMGIPESLMMKPPSENLRKVYRNGQAVWDYAQPGDVAGDEEPYKNLATWNQGDTTHYAVRTPTGVQLTTGDRWKPPSADDEITKLMQKRFDATSALATLKSKGSIDPILMVMFPQLQGMPAGGKVDPGTMQILENQLNAYLQHINNGINYWSTVGRAQYGGFGGYGPQQPGMMPDATNAPGAGVGDYIKRKLTPGAGQ